MVADKKEIRKNNLMFASFGLIVFIGLTVIGWGDFYLQAMGITAIVITLLSLGYAQAVAPSLE